MFIVEIPGNVSKLHFTNDFIKALQNKFENFEFINCTESPINEYTYFLRQGKHCRIINNNLVVSVDEKNYVDSYVKDNLERQGFSLSEYVEACLFFELEEILIAKKNSQCHMSSPVAKILVSPDGWSELLIEGAGLAFEEIVAFSKEYFNGFSIKFRTVNQKSFFSKLLHILHRMLLMLFFKRRKNL